MKKEFQRVNGVDGDELRFMFDAADGSLYVTVVKYGTTLCLGMSINDAKDLEDWLTATIMEVELERI